jgi:thiol-disulfide isomerase/thioredoxin
MFKILKYVTPSCTICRMIQPRLENIAKKNNAELKVIMVGSNNDLEITSVPTIKIQVGENTYDVCSGGNPNVILKTVEEKIAELHKQKVF